jgi:hypothetical protein
MKEGKSLRDSSHYVAHRIGADTDISNGLIERVKEALKKLEAKEDYVACLAVYDALEYHNTGILPG